MHLFKNVNQFILHMVISREFKLHAYGKLHDQIQVENFSK